jgi:predicted RNA-binding Zn ribbon-like protein
VTLARSRRTVVTDAGSTEAVYLGLRYDRTTYAGDEARSEAVEVTRTPHPRDEHGRVIPDGSWPAGREAPGALESVRRFVNTCNLESGADHLADSAHAVAWAQREGYDLGSALDERDVAELHSLRDALRTLALSHHDGSARVDPDGACAVLDRIAGRHAARIRFDPPGADPSLRPDGDGVGLIVVSILSAVRDAHLAGTWRRLKACRNGHCRWVFYDHSKNASGAWCSTLACGSRIKARNYRQRQRSQR